MHKCPAAELDDECLSPTIEVEAEPDVVTGLELDEPAPPQMPTAAKPADMQTPKRSVLLLFSGKPVAGNLQHQPEAQGFGVVSCDIIAGLRGLQPRQDVGWGATSLAGYLR